MSIAAIQSTASVAYEAPRSVTSGFAPQISATGVSLSGSLTGLGDSLQVRLDPDVKRFIFEYLDRESNQVVLQIPQESVIRYYQMMQDYLSADNDDLPDTAAIGDDLATGEATAHYVPPTPVEVSFAPASAPAAPTTAPAFFVDGVA